MKKPSEPQEHHPISVALLQQPDRVMQLTCFVRGVGRELRHDLGGTPVQAHARHIWIYRRYCCCLNYMAHVCFVLTCTKQPQGHLMGAGHRVVTIKGTVIICSAGGSLVPGL